MESIASDTRRVTLRAVMSTDPAEKKTLDAQRDQDVSKLDAAFAEYAKLISSPEEQALFGNIKTAWARYLDVDSKVVQLSDAGESSFAQARALVGGESATAFAAAMSLIADDMRLNHDGAMTEVANAGSSYQSTMVLTGVLVVIALVLGVVSTHAHAAQRSAAASKEIKDLINASVASVGNGSALVDEAGRTMREVVQSVRRVTDLLGEISAASGEQQTGIEQVNQAVVQMDEVTQQNAALVEQASAAAQSMAAQSQGLREVVSIFRLRDRAGATTLSGNA